MSPQETKIVTRGDSPGYFLQMQADRFTGRTYSLTEFDR